MSFAKPILKQYINKMDVNDLQTLVQKIKDITSRLESADS